MMMTENVDNSIIPEKKPKNYKPLIIAVSIILILAILGAGGYFGYKTIQRKKAEAIAAQKKKEEAEKQKEKDSYENINPESNQVVNLFEFITTGIGGYQVDKYFTNKEVKANDLSNGIVFDIVLKEIVKGIDMKVPNPTFTEDELSTKIVKYFGSSYSYKHKTVNSCPTITYDQTKRIYTYGNDICDMSTQIDTLMMKVTKAEKSDKHMIFYVRVLFRDGSKYYKDYEREKLITDLIPDAQGKYETVDYNYSLGSVYIMKFTKENNNYVFTSSKLKEEV